LKWSISILFLFSFCFSLILVDKKFGSYHLASKQFFFGSGEGWKQWWAAVRREAAIVMAVRLSLFEKEGYCLAAPLGGKL